jgi:hypothetical protein
MSYALYIDPTKTDTVFPVWPETPPTLAYYRLIDMTATQLEKFDPHLYPLAEYTIAEIHPQQWDKLSFAFDRISIVLEKSRFTSLTDIKAKVSATETDITFDWDHRFTLPYYIKLLNYWLYCGVTHFSFYGLSDFKTWQRLQQFLNSQNFFFYDRYHACVRGHESRYQKHIARFENMLAIGGWSRWTEEGITRTRAPKDKTWTRLRPEEQRLEQLLFALADRDGLSLSGLDPKAVNKAVQARLAEIHPPHVIPTDQGLWDTVELVSHLQQI